MIGQDGHDTIFELRQYTLHPGMRETLVELFDREFVESQEACGMTVIGQFRDLDRPDRFVWLRGFPNMSERAKALTAFYNGPVWAAHRDAANVTMIDFDDVLLLRPAGRTLDLGTSRRAASLDEALPAGLLTATIVPLAAGAADEFAALFETTMLPQLEAAGAAVLGTFVTETAKNNFPRLPIREDANMFVWFAAFASEPAQRVFSDTLGRSTEWQAAQQATTPMTAGVPETLRLQPTARSRLRSVSPIRR